VRVTVQTDRLDLADELEEDFVPVALSVVGRGGDLLSDEVRRRLRLRQGTRQTAAAEGQPPEEDTSALVRSVDTIKPRVVKRKHGGAMVASGTHVNHDGAARLEWGKTDAWGIRTYPHPYIRPSADAVAPQVEELLIEGLG